MPREKSKTRIYYSEMRNRILEFLADGSPKELEAIRVVARDDSNTVRSQLEYLHERGLIQKSKPKRVEGTFRVRYRLTPEKANAGSLDRRAAG